MITQVRSYNSDYKYIRRNEPNHKGGIKTLNKFNPIVHYTNDYFTRMAKISNTKFQPIIPALKNLINHVEIKSGTRKLKAWDINPNNSGKYILFLHGMAQNINDYQDLYNMVVDQGNYGILALEYSSYGENRGGKPTEDNLIKDSKNGLKYLIREKNIQPENIIIAGHSMGGSIATSLASKQNNLKGLLLICPIIKTEYLGKKFTENQRLGMGIPQKIQMFTETIKPLKWLYSFVFNSLDKVKKVSCPIYLIHSKNDTVTSLQGARNFVKTATRNKVHIEYHYLNTGGHKVDKNKIDMIREFLDSIE